MNPWPSEPINRFFLKGIFSVPKHFREGANSTRNFPLRVTRKHGDSPLFQYFAAEGILLQERLIFPALDWQRIGIINDLFLGRSCSKRAGKRGRGADNGGF
jgi:hypothetical protein